MVRLVCDVGWVSVMKKNITRTTAHCKLNVRYWYHDKVIEKAHSADMVKVGNPRWFLRQWRKHRGYTQDHLAEMIGTSKGYLSDLERGVRRFNQDLLEQLAVALKCSPADLIRIDPSKGEDTIWSIYDTLTPVQQKQAVAVLKAIKGESTGTDG